MSTQIIELAAETDEQTQTLTAGEARRGEAFPAIPAHISEQDESELEFTRFKRRWSIQPAPDLKRLCVEIGSAKQQIEGILPVRSIGLLVGDSGLGKSALIYQMGVCVAAGIDFLGHKVQQGRVLCLDFENGLGQVDAIVSSLSRYLGLSEPPKDLLTWNVHYSSSNYGQPGATAYEMIQDVKPSLVTIDSLTAFHPDIEEKNATATGVFQRFRKLIRDTDASIIGIHHRKKPSDFSPLLEDESPRPWFTGARGASALINGSDVRLGVDVPSFRRELEAEDSNTREEVAMVFRGFGRVRGEIPLNFLSRVYDESGEPLGYKRITGAHLLFNADQQAAFKKLPERFRFKEAEQVYGRRAQATTDFLNKCVGVGLLQRVPGGYLKVID